MEVNKTIKVCREILIDWEKYVILDTETTGLTEKDVIIQIAIIDLNGNELVNTNVRSIKAKRISKEATEVHGINTNMLRFAPSFGEIIDDIYKLSKNKIFLIYNAEFDGRMLKQTCYYNNLNSFNIRAICIQKLYSIFKGEWSEYYNNYKFQKLPNSSHNAKGDCLATLNLIKKIAKNDFTILPEEKYTIFGKKINLF